MTNLGVKKLELLNKYCVIMLINEVWCNNKTGKLVQVKNLAQDAETLEKVVVYCELDKPSTTWTTYYFRFTKQFKQVENQ